DSGICVEQIVARHPRLPGDAGGDDDDVGVGRLFVAVGADDARVEFFNRRGLPLIESLSLRDSFLDVDEDDGARELFFGETLGSRRADIAGTDDGDLVYHSRNISGLIPDGNSFT